MTTINTILLAAATALIPTGVATIANSLWVGAIEIVLGLACVVFYEKLPASNP